MFNKDLKQLVVLDELRERLETVDSDIIPESEAHPLVTGIENVPSTIISMNGSDYSAPFTTFPLSPLQGRVNYIKDNFLHFNIDFSFGVALAENLPADLYLYVGPRDTASIFSQLQLLIDNNIIWTTTMHHIESAIAMAALPASVVDHNNQYATIDKLLAGKPTPMKLIKIPADTYGTYSANASAATQAKCVVPINLTYDFTIDLNRLCIPLSSIDFITSNMGNLRLRCYLNNIDQTFYMMPVPQGFNLTGSGNKKSLNTVQNGLISLVPVSWGSVTYGTNVITMTNPNIIAIPSQITDLTAGATTINNEFIPIQFIKRTASQTINFMQVNIGEICQTCFDIEESSWDKLSEYFASIGHVIMPTQVFSTTQFNNGSITIGESIGSSLLANVPGNNITDVVITATPINAQTCIMNTYLNNIQALLDGKPLNCVSYEKINNRAITDFTNACVDTDKDEINTDYMYSLQFPPLISSKGNDKTFIPSRGSNDYFYTDDFEMFSTIKNSVGSTDYYIKNPNLFMYVFQTGLPETFHTGMCIIENTTRQAILRLQTQGLQGNAKTEVANRFLNVKNCIASEGAAATATKYQYDGIASASQGLFKFIGMPCFTNYNTQFNVSSLCDVCIVLDYDRSLNTCIGGNLSYAKPFISDE